MTTDRARRARKWLPRLWVGYALVWVVYAVLSFTVVGGPTTTGQAIQFLLSGGLVVVGLLTAWQIRREDDASGG